MFQKKKGKEMRELMRLETALLWWYSQLPGMSGICFLLPGGCQQAKALGRCTFISHHEASGKQDQEIPVLVQMKEPVQQSFHPVG